MVRKSAVVCRNTSNEHFELQPKQKTDTTAGKGGGGTSNDYYIFSENEKEM